MIIDAQVYLQMDLNSGCLIGESVLYELQIYMNNEF